MPRFFAHWLALTIALAATAYVLPGVDFESFAALLVGGIVLAFVNAVIRPVLTILTLPVTILTLGGFYLVVNGVAFAMAAYVTPGFSVSTAGSAVLGALLTSAISWMIAGRDDAKSRRQRHGDDATSATA